MPVQYSILAMQQKLFPHLREVQEAAERRLELIMDGLLAQNPGPDKATDQLGWVQHRNCLKAQAEEIIFSELIFAWKAARCSETQPLRHIRLSLCKIPGKGKPNNSPKPANTTTGIYHKERKRYESYRHCPPGG